MKSKEMQQEALSRAVNSLGTMNYGIIYNGFISKGIQEEDIKPRENIFTFNAWKALGRYVKAGEHGVRITVFIKYANEIKDPETGTVKIETGSSPKSTTVFHISQTMPVNGGK